jgi:carboxymethylenebutenolidase
MFYREQRAPIVTGMPVPARVKDLPEILRQIMPLVDRFDPAAALRDTQTFIDDLAARQGVRPGPFGIFGYCMGGAMAIRTGAAFPDKFAAVASFHAGRLVTQDPQSPHRLLPKLRGALYVGHADQDPHMNTAQIKEFAEAAAELTIPHENELYEGAHHHFTMNDLPAYNKAAAEKAWRKLTALFEKALQPAK